MERKQRHIIDVAITLKFQNGVLHKFWGDCVRTIVYLINKLPSTVLNEKFPFEVLHGKPAVLDHLRVFVFC